MKRLALLMAVLMVLAVGVPALVIVGSEREVHGATGSWKVDLNAKNGFGDSKNTSASPFAVYNNNLYVGVASESGCRVFKRGSSSWKSVSEPGLGNSKNLAIGKMAVYNNKLYVGTGNANMGSMSGGISSDGCELYSYDGTNWKKIAGEGFGNKNNVAVTSMAVFGGKLYIGVANVKVGISMGIPPSVSVSSDGGSVFSYDGTTLKSVGSGGFGDKENIGVTALAPFGGKLYAGTAKAQVSVKVIDMIKGESEITLTSKGCELRKLEGSSWKKIAGDGITDTRNLAITTMCNYGGKLLIGTMNGDGSATVLLNLTNIEASQISDFQYQTNGFFIYSFDGSTPVVMVANGVESKEEFAALSIKPITMNEKEFLLASIGTTSGVARLLTYNGGSWYKGAKDGFGNEKNTAFADICVFGGSAFVGTANIEGCEIWRGLPPTAPPPTPTWYLAEGSTDWGYSTYITVINPNNEAVNIEVTYQTRDGEKEGGTFPMAPQSQLKINPTEKIGATDFSTKVECKEGKTIAVDRTMTWVGPGAASEEAHNSVGVTSPSTTWYLPEGSASWGFECWLLIQNPNDKEAVCNVTYMTEYDGPKTVEKRIPPNTRGTWDMALDLPDVATKDASIKVESTNGVPVIPERAMYRNSRREGHDSIGTTTPANEYFLAEGAVGYASNFITYVLVQNPNETPTNVDITYLTPSGAVEHPGGTITMPANSRKTVRLNDFLPPNTDVSTKVVGDKPIIAERAIYWNGGPDMAEVCHDSVGMPSPHKIFYLPDGCSEMVETWTLVQNPNSSDIEVEVSYFTIGGSGNVSFIDRVSANSRKTYNMADKLPLASAAIVVESKTPGKKIMVERAMYWDNRGAGTDTIGGYAD